MAKEYSDEEKEELLEGMDKIVSRVLNDGLWNSGQRISELRELLSIRDVRNSSQWQRVLKWIDELVYPEPMKGRLHELADSPSQWNELVVRLELEKTWPNAKP